MYPRVILPAIASGVMWGIATACWFIANKVLSEPVSFPIVTTIPGAIASLFWGVLIFHEIKVGTRILSFLSFFHLVWFLFDRLCFCVFQILIFNSRLFLSTACFWFLWYLIILNANILYLYLFSGTEEHYHPFCCILCDISRQCACWFFSWLNYLPFSTYTLRQIQYILPISALTLLFSNSLYRKWCFSERLWRIRKISHTLETSFLF